MEEDKIEEVENVDAEVEPTTEPPIENQPQVEKQIQPVKKKGHKPSLNRGSLTKKKPRL